MTSYIKGADTTVFLIPVMQSGQYTLSAQFIKTVKVIELINKLKINAVLLLPKIVTNLKDLKVKQLVQVDLAEFISFK